MADPPEPDPVVGVPGYAAGTGRHHDRPRHPSRQPSNPSPPREMADVVSVLGVSEDHLTPEVSSALRALMDEVERLRWEASRSVRLQVFHEQQANLDSVLPIMHRRAFMRELEDRVGRAGVAGALAYFHLDSYEPLRQQHGLAVAEEALRQVAATLLKNIRDSDLAGAIGGGGIGVILAVTEAPGAHSKVDSLLDKLRRQPFRWGEQNVNLVLSCGLHEFVAGETAESALASADAALRGPPPPSVSVRR